MIIVPYTGYGTHEKAYVSGRVLRDKKIRVEPGESAFSNFLDAFRRINSAELKSLHLQLKYKNLEIDLVTDEEGYYRHTLPLETEQPKEKVAWERVSIAVREAKSTNDDPHPAVAQNEIMLPPKEADFGIISDIDDTILKTGVASRFKWRAAYNTLFKNHYQRLPFEGAADVFQLLASGNSGKHKNPVFYLSHSPWNLYRSLKEFLYLHNFPMGPLLLRDYGLHTGNRLREFRTHKVRQLETILQTYPRLRFILLGDAGEKDPDYYLKIASKYRDRIPVIFIRQVGRKKKRDRLRALIENNAHIPVVAIDHSSQILQHCSTMGLV